MRTRRAIGRGATLVALLALAGCGVERPQVPTVGQPLADFTLESVNGDVVSLADFSGDVVLVNLWATWCPPCRSETPYLQELHDRHAAEGFRVVGISVDQAAAREAVDGFLGDYGVTYTQLLDPDMATMDRYGVIGLPASYLVDRSGIVRFVRLGPLVEGDREFETVIAEAIAAQ